MLLEKFITTIPDFPKKGILFRDVTPVLKNFSAFNYTIDKFKSFAEKVKPDVIVAPEARGFWFGPTLAFVLQIPFVVIRKKGKLPQKIVEVGYQLEYGVDYLQMHANDLKKGQKVFLFDDVLATGGTISACKKLIEKTGAQFSGAAFIGNIKALQGEKSLKDIPWLSLLEF